MTDLPDIPDATDRWRAAIKALEEIVQTASNEAKSASEIDPAEAEEVRHLIMVRIATRRRSALPASWVRRPGIVMPHGADPEPAAELKEGRLDQRLPSRPVWRE